MTFSCIRTVALLVCFALLGGAADPMVAADRWGDTHLVPPDPLVGLPLYDAITGDSVVLPLAGETGAASLG